MKPTTLDEDLQWTNRAQFIWRDFPPLTPLAVLRGLPDVGNVKCIKHDGLLAIVQKLDGKFLTVHLSNLEFIPGVLGVPRHSNTAKPRKSRPVKEFSLAHAKQVLESLGLL